MGKVSCDLARFQRVKELIRAQGCDIIINFSTSGASGLVNEGERFNSLAAGPELASFDAGSELQRVSFNPIFWRIVSAPAAASNRKLVLTGMI
jgi:uncharacterized protein (DUF849 family)